MPDSSLFDAASAATTRISLTRLCSEIARSLARLGRVAVEGEVVKPRTQPSGWTYFTLADRAARLPVSCPAEHARRCRTVHGERVLVTGTVSFSLRSGQLSLQALEVVPVGLGAIEAAIAATRAELEAEGVLARPRLALPLLPRTIGVVCGSEAAVRGDIEAVVDERFPGFPVEFREVVVSGAGAVDGIIGALRSFAARPEVEVVIVARGGGDAVSLFPFSDGELCRAMAAMPVPVVTAIGHERDRPLCDEVSDVPCATPSLAAVRVVPEEAELRRAADQVVDEARRVLTASAAALTAKLASVDVRGSLGTFLNLSAHRLAMADVTGILEGRLETAAARIGGASAALEALSPQAVLRRGYAVVRRGDGRVVRSAGDVAAGAVVEVTLASGRFGAVVTDTGDSTDTGDTGTDFARAGRTAEGTSGVGVADQSGPADP